jgi:hypothetical protein
VVLLETIVGRDHIADMCGIAAGLPEGCFVEVGVYKGGCAQQFEFLAVQQGRKMFAYDTFTGIPYRCDKDSHKVGDFNDTSYEAVKAGLPNTTVVQGVFPASAVEMPPIAFVHLDCDQYQSIKDSVEYLKDKMVEGGVMIFDDYGCLPGATEAVDELFGDKVQRTKHSKAIVTF